jgi:lipid II isoglutaminyl synthase (glutamine-hydrolysing)
VVAYARAVQLRVPLAAEIAAARGVAALSRLVGTGGGTTVPGKLLSKLDPGAIDRLAARLPAGTAVISATNGKTTTSAMAAEILVPRFRLAHNRSGANLVSGIASTLLASNGAELGLLEVDEAALPEVIRRVHPRAVCLGNLFRDQLDRYGELELVAERWRGAVTALDEASMLVVNGDDPQLGALAAEHRLTTVYGLDDPRVARPALQHAADSKYCIRCGTPYDYAAAYVGHLGDYHCPNCGHARPALEVAARSIELAGLERASFDLVTPEGSRRIELALPGLYNVYNALGAAALCLELSIGLETVVAGLGAVTAAFGRAQTVTVGSNQLQVMLVKNPAGANEILRTLALEGIEPEVLAILNDRTADGRDISWIWDADFELLDSHVRRITCAGTRAAELALRLKYAGIPGDLLEVQPELARALDAALATTASGRLFVLPTYTALLELHSLLAARGHVHQFWEPSPGGAP